MAIDQQGKKIRARLVKLVKEVNALGRDIAAWQGKQLGFTPARMKKLGIAWQTKKPARKKKATKKR